MSSYVKASVRVSSSFKPYHHDKAKCEMLDSVIKELPEIADQIEPFHPKKTKLCWHNCLCYEVECGFAHTYTIEARKKIRKAFSKAEKAQKIKDEIKKIGEEGFAKSWGDY
jgi:hypothetical protein